MEKSCGNFFFSWPEAFQAGVGAAGGKGWNLGRLERYGFRVPIGGVLAAGACQSFIEENGLLEATGEIARSVTIGNIGDKEIEQKLLLIREKIKAACIPPNVRDELESSLKTAGILDKPLAVRSSATDEDSGKASFAGVHESFLNVRGMDDILTAIKGCYASLWTPRAVAYRRKMNFRDDEVIPAVVIMEMVEAEAAGVGFTCDPQTGQEDLVLINANFGLGESVVSGAVDPDEYRLDYAFEITHKRIGRKEGKTIARKTGGTEYVEYAGSPAGQVLSDENIRRLGLLIQRVFDSLGCGEQHQDIEWVFDGKDFALVQARPVTALPRYTFDELKNQPDIWSNANLKDAQPMVQSTLNWSLLNYLVLGIDMPGYQGLPGLKGIRLYQGRAYWNLSIIQWINYDAFGITPRQINEFAGGFQPEIKINEKKPYRGIKGLKRLGRLLKVIFSGMRNRKNAPKYFAKVESLTAALLKENFKDMAERDLINKISEVRSTFREYWPVFMTFVSGSDTSLLVKVLEKYFPAKGKAVANALMAGGGDITSAQHGYRLVEMAEIARGDAAARRFFTTEPFNPLLWDKELPEESPLKQSLRSFLAEYGHRGVYEYDIINPRWREDPSYLLNVVRSTMETADLGKIKARQKEKADEVRREVSQKVPFYRRGFVNSMLKQALKGAELREAAKSVLVKIQTYDMRLIFQEIGRRLAGKRILAEPADIYHCAWSDILSILRGDWGGRGLDVLVAERKARRKEMEALSPPDLIIDEVLHFIEPVIRSSGNALTGMGVAAGRASGAAKLIYHPDEGEKLQAGDVLVAPSTDPGWTPLFLRASAIVMETGGSISHGAIVAREYGIPAVVNIPGVMKMINDSQLITVDGDEGKVYL
ncbi:MAG: pyruvate phosphate dikinase [Peptococcaceae bacterium BRH_c4b]|nr:MAG: pyruvate phosphate dikinase [Peptococcaceae bacterium BRH_c4b]